MGAGGEELAFQEFPPGSSELDLKGTAKLDIVIEGLRRWPELMLDVEGSVDPKKDVGDLRLLAAKRAQAVREYLLGKGSLEPGRVFLVDDPGKDAPSGGSRALLFLQDQYAEPRK